MKGRDQMARRTKFGAVSVGLLGAIALVGSSLLSINSSTAAGPLEEPTVAGLTSNCKSLPVKTAKVGILVPLGGSFASDTMQVVNSAGLAVKKLNAAGGVCGKSARYKFEIVKGNTNNMEASAVTSAAQLLNTTKDLNFVMTSYASTSNFELNIFAKTKMPYLLSANSQQTADIISKDPSKYPTIWSRVPSYDGYQTELPKVLNQLEKDKKITFKHGKTVYIISSTDPYGSTIANGLKENFPKNGWKVIGFESVNYAGVQDWQAALAKIRQNVPDLIVVTNSTASDDAALQNQFYDSPTDSLMFQQYAPSVPQYLELTGAKANGVMYNMLGGAIPTLASTKTITAEFTAKYGTPGYFAVVAYNQLMLYAHCVQQVGNPTDRLGIGKCFSKLNIKTPSGVLQFDQKTHLAKQSDTTYPILFSQIQDGKLNVITPKQYAASEFQVPPWMK
jgi:branched-chain amino acid transport system substrate-binding protein